MTQLTTYITLLGLLMILLSAAVPFLLAMLPG
jgi:hypothetical protein